MLRPQTGHAHSAENSAQREALPSASPGGDPHTGASAQAGQGEHIQRHTLLRVVLLPQSHLHHVRAALDELVRVDQEEQVCRLLAAAGAQVYPLDTAMFRRAKQEQNHTLRSEAREHTAEAAGPQRHQSDRLRLQLL